MTNSTKSAIIVSGGMPVAEFEYEEVNVAGKTMFVSWGYAIDPHNFNIACPKCGGEKKEAFKILIDITEVSVGDGRTSLELTAELLASVEASLRLKLVQDGNLVTTELMCSDCRGAAFPGQED